MESLRIRDAVVAQVSNHDHKDFFLMVKKSHFANGSAEEL